MNTNHPATKNRLRRTRPLTHKHPVCNSTGLPRYRDRHQARQVAQARTAGERDFSVSTFACPDCRGFHHETMPKLEPAGTGSVPAQTHPETHTRPRRYVLVDIENLTQGATATPEKLAELWKLIRNQAPGFTSNDHVVVGAARSVVRKYRGVIHGPNVKWVVGADAPDGADRALLSAIDLYRTARDFDELVIMSGDHAFAELAVQARTIGLKVRVVTIDHKEGRSMLSGALSRAATVRVRIRRESRSQTLSNIASLHEVARATPAKRTDYARAA